MDNIDKIKNEIVLYGKRMREGKYIVGAQGNLSIRLDNGNIAITPSGFNKGFMSLDDIVICDKDGKKILGQYQPSSEYKIHVLIYKYRYDVKAVCHGHPVNATAFACAGKPLNKAVLPEILVSLGAVPLVEYATPGSDKLSQNLANYLGRYDAFLLQSHGVVTLGKSLDEAFNRLEKVERYANILRNAEQIGGAKLLSKSETELLLKLSGRESILDDIEYA
jgi:L-fuculose-phosphate aldolase